MDIVLGRFKGPRRQIVRPQETLKTDEELELATRKINAFVQYDRCLETMADDAYLLQALTMIMGESPQLVQDQAILKPPIGGAEKPWHQDMAYGPLTYEKPVIGVWIALDEALIENGCMHIIPRSHMDGPTPHYVVRDLQICDTSVPVDRDMAVPLQPGGILFFHGMLYHGTPPNFSKKRRRALQFHYAPESCQRMSHDEYRRWFTNEMTNAEC